MTLKLAELLEWTGACTVGTVHAREFARLRSDARLVLPGELFVAALTFEGDGYDDIASAVQAGAAGLLIERQTEDIPDGVTVLRVDSVPRALASLGRRFVEQSHADVIGVSGSVGKTLTRALIAHLLGGRFSVFQADGGADGRIGLPVVLSALAPGHQKAVLEIGSNAFGEVGALAEMIRPRTGVVTSVDEAGIEVFGSVEAVAAEQAALFAALPAGGLAVLNADDLRAHGIAAEARSRVVTFGLDGGADVHARSIELDAMGVRFALVTPSGERKAALSLPGRHLLYPALAAVAVALEYGLGLEEIADRLASFEALPGRGRPLKGVDGCMILDETGGATTSSVFAALDSLGRMPAVQRIAVLGDIPGLGERALEVHHEVGKKAAQVTRYLVGRGDLGREIALAAVAAGMPREAVGIAYTNEDAATLVRRAIQPGAVVLAQGGTGMRMEQVVERLMLHPERAASELVRQGAEWRAKRPPHYLRATWMDVDLEAIANNTRELVRIVGPNVQVMAVVKANGYGLGTVKCAQTAINNGATCAGVACMGEAIELRQAGVTEPVLVLGYTPPWAAREMVRYRLSAAIFSMEVARALSRAAVDLRTPARVHVKVDSGMGRLGLLPDKVLPFLREIKELPGLELEGIFSHYATADEGDLTHARRQLSAFSQVVETALSDGYRFRYIHASNSSGTLTLPDGHYNLVRPGTLMYGMHPSSDVPRPPEFKNAFALKCEIAQVKRLPKGSCVGYGCTYITPGPRTIAAIPVGYADGVRRSPIHWGEVLVHGRRVPIVGRVCMDQAMIDVTDLAGVRAGDEVVLIGRQGDDEITMDEVAARIGTIINEVTSGILSRVPRVS